jgi:general secretion pathway protein E
MTAADDQLIASVPPRDKRSLTGIPKAPAKATLTLRDICTALVSSGDILQTDAERVLSANLGSAGGDTAPRHPLKLVAMAALTSRRLTKYKCRPTST